MIRFRNSAFKDHVHDSDSTIVEGELLSSAIERVFGDIDMETFEVGTAFVAVVNGHKIDKDFWEFTALKETDDVIISPNLQSGESGQIFRQIALLTVTIVASVFLTPVGGATIGSALAVAGLSVVAGLLLNALIPPPIPSTGINNDTPLSQSQMYAITGQSNAVKKFGIVPKVYGTHRFFPNVAANPYTELEADSDGNLSQFLYAVYDLGLGPTLVQNIYIGDTPISEFTDVTYNLVDFNRPAVSEGVWDYPLADHLQLYYGDRDSDPANYALNYDQVDGGPSARWQVIRNTPANNDATPMEVSIPLVNPGGLHAYSPGGVIGTRTINMEVEFQDVLLDPVNDSWSAYNNLNYVDSYSVIGGAVGASTHYINNYPFAAPLTQVPPDYNNNIAEYTSIISETNPDSPVPGNGSPYGTRVIGYAAGSTSIIVTRNPVPPYYSPASGNLANGNGTSLYYNGTLLGKILSSTAYPAGSGNSSTYLRIIMDQPLPVNIPIFVQYGDLQYHFAYPSASHYFYRYQNAGSADLSYPPSIYFNTPNERAVTLTAQTTSPLYSAVKFVPKVPKQYRVRVRRVSSTSANTYQIQDDLTLAGISTRFDRAPILTTKRHVFLEVRIKATNQLNGQIQNLSALCTSVLEYYDPVTSAWYKTLTSNPAWVVADLLTGEVNKRAVDKSRLDVDSFVEWADFCDEVPTPPTGYTYLLPRFTTNFILDYEGTLQSTIAQVAGACQASLNIVDGKYGILLDRLRTTPVQIFTPRNSRGFTSSRNYSQRADGFSVQFIDTGADWSISQIVAYDNGFNSSNAEEPEPITAFACTNHEQAWRFGRYMIAQSRLRQETISLTVDFEHLICSRGDYVQITQDVMKVGGTPARVTFVSGTTIEIDEDLEFDSSKSYGYVYRSVTGDIKTSTLTFVSSYSFVLAGDVPEVGDLIVIGVVGKIVFECIIKSITPSDEMSANLVLVERAAEIYDYESTDLFPDYEPNISPTVDAIVSPPGAVTGLVVVDNAYTCDSTGFHYYIDLDWSGPSNSVYERFDILLNKGPGYSVIATTTASAFHYVVQRADLNVAHSFKVIAVSALGNKIEMIAAPSVTATPLRKTSAPANVASFTANTSPSTIALSWTLLGECGLARYAIRFNPSLATTVTWDTSTPIASAAPAASTVSLPAQNGTYLIKAVDFEGNESASAETVITSIPELLNLNISEILADAPFWTGTKDKVAYLNPFIALAIDGSDNYWAEGYYYFQNLLDLKAVASVNLSSSVVSQGFNKVGGAIGSGDWSVEVQYRTADDFIVMSDWDALADQATLAAGDISWSPWTGLTSSIATGRVFQFRIKLLSNTPHVTPKITSVSVTADMPDRTESYNNLNASSSTDYSVVYSPGFVGPTTSPNVQITLENGQSGDYWQFVAKSLEGFTIRFFDKNGQRISRQFDAAVKGYGYKVI